MLYTIFSPIKISTTKTCKTWISWLYSFIIEFFAGIMQSKEMYLFSKLIYIKKNYT